MVYTQSRERVNHPPLPAGHRLPSCSSGKVQMYKALFRVHWGIRRRQLAILCFERFCFGCLVHVVLVKIA